MVDRTGTAATDKTRTEKPSMVFPLLNIGRFLCSMVWQSYAIDSIDGPIFWKGQLLIGPSHAKLGTGRGKAIEVLVESVR